MPKTPRSNGSSRPRLRLALVLAAVLAAPLLASGRAHAGVTLVIQRGTEPESTMYLDGDKMRMENPKATSDRTVVIDATAKRITTINDAEKSYTEITDADMDRMAAMMASRRAMMEDRMKSMPPEQRKKMEAMMGGDGKDHELKFEKMGAKKTVNGFSCDMYRVTEEGKPKEEDCVSPWSKGVLSREDFAGLRKYSEDMAKRMGSMAGGGSRRVFEQFDKYPGFPVVRHSLEPGDRADEVLKSAKRGSIPASLFAPPAGYTKKPSPFSTMGAGPHGGPGGRPMMMPPQ